MVGLFCFKNMLFKVYIIYSNKIDKFYVGYSGDILEERIRKHNTNHKGFTGKANDWELKYFEEYSEKSEAIKRELSIKNKKSRKHIERLIAG
ncbi:GIY-YIG nuclease family protein [Winogradskyella jejuensis]|uniref:Putative endonuclease n=1 Tax=Winogradskyella jejuensis TaxID=1089305 RepID=A0A1M5TRH4_9FLAO|nr:GIY-YIG nuclease family protein [Winogradskyella jejuensis]SHH53281.1 putative endonuclease [Winogradskyella jejuensis]